MSRLVRGAAAAIALAALAAPSAPAQGWSVDVGAGSTAHQSVPGAGSLGAVLGVRYAGTRWFGLSANVPFDAVGLPWAAAGAGGRIATRGAFTAGIDLSAQGFAYQDRDSGTAGGGVTAMAMPMVGIGPRAARLELRSGLLQYSSSFAGVSASRTMHQSDARFSLGAAGFRVSGEGRYLRAAEGDYPYAGGDAEVVAGPASAYAYAGRWLHDSLPDAAWGAGGRLRVAGGTELFAGYQRDGGDPVYWNPPRSTWTVGLTRRLGRAAPAARLPAPRQRAGTVTFRLPLSASAQAPAVAGDFTRWTPVAMRREGAFWIATLPVRPGVHRYAFRRADGAWFVPEGLPGRTDDGFGGVTAVLVVSAGGA